MDLGLYDELDFGANPPPIFHLLVFFVFGVHVFTRHIYLGYWLGIFQ